MHVVVTAGHVDHGKSTLLRALTGREPDRLEEERRRGLSIELGYVWTEVDGVGEVAFVDVPGHQRFVTTALAGMGPVPVVLFAVAADDPWMPQAAEHLAALDALGVDRGALVVTRADLADPAPALAAARSRLAGTSLASVPAVAVSARTGLGLADLRATVARVLGDVRVPDPAADVRLWVDRRFHVRGAGTVVTGTLPAGTVRVGDVLEAGPGGPRVRVRGLESLSLPRASVSGVARVALDLGGGAPREVARGRALVTPGAYAAAELLDVRLAGDGDPPERPLLHVGSTAQQVHVRGLAAGYGRLRLFSPLPLRVGDRAVLRDPGSRRVWGVVVLDPAPPPLGRRGAAAARAAALAEHGGTVGGVLAVRGGVRLADLRRWGVPAEPLPAGAVVDGAWVLSAEEAAARAAGRPAPTPDSTPEDEAALAGLAKHLADAPFAAPDAATLAALGLDDGAAVRLHRAGRLLRVAPGIVLLLGADDLAVRTLGALEQPFTTSAAREALGTSRRVVLPLLAHLDRTGRTVRLADDTRRLRDHD